MRLESYATSRCLLNLLSGSGETGSYIWYRVLPIKKVQVRKMMVAEMRMIRWMCGDTMRDKIRNQFIRNKVGVALIEHKTRGVRLRWCGHVIRRASYAPMKICERIILRDAEEEEIE